MKNIRAYVAWVAVVTFVGIQLLLVPACGDATLPPGTCKGALDCPGSQVCTNGLCVVIKSDGGGTTDAAGTDDSSPDDATDQNGTPDTTKDEGNKEDNPEPPDMGPTCIDEDKDGYCQNIPGDRGAIDCNDKNDKIFPTATEVCNGEDDNCNGKIDEDLKAPACKLTDGVCAGAVQTCDGKNGWKACDDTAYSKHSGGAYEATEMSCDGVDNDCDGQTDETFSEQGKDCTDNSQKGECSRGKYECDSGKVKCVSATKPVAEVCGNGKDDNCDGQTDEKPPCTCKAGATEKCYSGTQGCALRGGTYYCTTPCKAGVRTCGTDSQWGKCVGEVLPTTELCNGKDDNCDGKIDETFPTLGRSCTAGKGECAATGKIVCTSTKTAACNARPGRPTNEVCDGKDNDCDGLIDDGLRKATYYQDLDKDGYGNPNVTRYNCRQPIGYTTKSGDCYDKNANAKPGQTLYFSTHRGDGSFDYNCDKRISRYEYKCFNCKGYTWATSKITCGKLAPRQRCSFAITACKKTTGSSIVMRCR